MLLLQLLCVALLSHMTHPAPPNTAPSSSVSLCSVTGSTVIDFLDAGASIPDRCVYTLISGGGLEVLGAFLDRRRKDINLLDNVIIRMKQSVEMNLGQGSIVQVNGTLLNLTTSQTVHQVEISKDSAGVTATVPFSSPISVFFDGYTAQIYMEGGDPSSLSGLCADASSALSAMKSAEFSFSGCETTHQQNNDSSIDCSAVTQHCDALTDPPFSDCHSDFDPKPYITACTNTLCKYPAKDGIKCSFHEAYARACSLRNVSLANWRPKNQCPPQQALCQDMFCSDHEYCGVDNSGAPACLCRAVFASKYTTNNTFGEPTVCDGTSASLSLFNCLLIEKGISYSKLHLRDFSCKGQMDPVTHLVTFEFNSTNTCGTVLTKENNKVYLKNSIQRENATGMVVRHDQFDLEFSCSYDQPEIKNVVLKIKDSSVVIQVVSGAWIYTLSMNAYEDLARTKPIAPDTEIQLDQRVFVELKTTGLDGNLLSVVTDSCWATNQPSANSALTYDLVKNGCPNPGDGTVETIGNGEDMWNVFSFNMFQFTGDSSDVYLHCKVELCVKTDNVCAPVCGKNSSRRRRSLRSRTDLTPAFISMTWI